MTISWDDKYRVGVEKFDAQHINFFKILDRLTQDAAKGEDAVRASVDGLLLYVTEHFHDEESLMLECKYQGYEEHLREHEKLLQKTQRIYSEMDMGHPPSVEQMRELLVNWIQDHILKVDQNYVPFFREKGVR